MYFQCYYNNAHKSIINDDDDNNNSYTFSMPVCKIWRKNNTIYFFFLNQIKTFKVSFFFRCQCQSCWCDPLRDCILTFFGLMFVIFHSGLWYKKFMEKLTNDSGYVIIGEDEGRLLKKLTNEAKSALTMMIFSIIFAVYLLVIQITCFTSFIAYLVSLTWGKFFSYRIKS